MPRVGYAMERVSMLDFRRDAEAIIRKVQHGQRLFLTYRGKVVMRLEPVRDQELTSDDPLYSLGLLAVSGGESLSNDEIDEIVYQG